MSNEDDIWNIPRPYSIGLFLKDIWVKSLTLNLLIFLDINSDIFSLDFWKSRISSDKASGSTGAREALSLLKMKVEKGDVILVFKFRSSWERYRRHDRPD